MHGSNRRIGNHGHIGPSLRQHPLAFLRAELASQKILSCEELQRTKDGRYVSVAGLVLVPPRPGSAKGVMFITIEDEHANANLIFWPSLLEQSRQIVMNARLPGVYGQVQREGVVIHVIAKRLTYLSSMLSALGDRDARSPAKLGRGDGATSGGGPDPRSGKPQTPSPRDIYIPPLHLDEISEGTQFSVVLQLQRWREAYNPRRALHILPFTRVRESYSPTRSLGLRRPTQANMRYTILFRRKGPYVSDGSLRNGAADWLRTCSLADTLNNIRYHDRDYRSISINLINFGHDLKHRA